jgi:hypothetical protein
MEQTESTGNIARERDAEEDAGGIEQVVANPSTADSGVGDGNLQNAEPAVQFPATPLHHSPKEMTSPMSATMPILDKLAATADECDNVTVSGQITDHDLL